MTVTSDPDAEYEKVFEFDVEKVELGVAKPMSPDNYAPLSEVAGTKLDQVFTDRLRFSISYVRNRRWQTGQDFGWPMPTRTSTSSRTRASA